MSEEARLPPHLDSQGGINNAAHSPSLLDPGSWEGEEEEGIGRGLSASANSRPPSPSLINPEKVSGNEK